MQRVARSERRIGFIGYRIGSLRCPDNIGPAQKFRDICGIKIIRVNEESSS